MHLARGKFANAESGFTLIEVLIAGLILSVGLISLAYVFGAGLSIMMSAQDETIARQKAREAVESVLTGRNTENLTFDQICNYSEQMGCVFQDGFTALTTPGADGMVNTADDGTVETIVQPGPDGDLGTGDDVTVPLNNFQREIRIRKLSPILREVRVAIQYRTSTGLLRTFSMVSYVSPYI